MRLNMNQRFELIKLMKELSKPGQELTANEIQDRALALGLNVEKSSIYHTAKELGMNLRRERPGAPKATRLMDLDAKVQQVDAELQRIKDALKKLYKDGFGVSYPEEGENPPC